MCPPARSGRDAARHPGNRVRCGAVGPWSPGPGLHCAGHIPLQDRLFPPPKGGFSNNRGGTWVPEFETLLTRSFKFHGFQAASRVQMARSRWASSIGTLHWPLRRPRLHRSLRQTAPIPRRPDRPAPMTGWSTRRLPCMSCILASCV